VSLEATRAHPGRSRFPIAREGYRIIALAWALPLLFWLAGWTILTLVTFALAIFVTSFFRDPERRTPVDPKTVVAPADGRVIKVAQVQDERFLHGQALLIAIFMSPLNVHVNRVPTSGRVLDVRYNHGKYFRAFADKASLDNEQNAILMEDPEGRRFCFVQIAGFIARRIVCYLRPGNEVTRGERCGIIMFGSRVDIFLPTDAVACVEVGQSTAAGETVVARWP
jgi:phosphatidylserine decarboxylase